MGRGLYVVGFIVGDGRGRGRGLGLEPAASLSCHSSTKSSVRGSPLTFMLILTATDLAARRSETLFVRYSNERVQRDLQYGDARCDV